MNISKRVEIYYTVDEFLKKFVPYMEQQLLTISEKGPTTGWFYGNNYNPEFRLGNKIYKSLF